MLQNIDVFDPTANDELSKVRGVGRYLQLLKENFPGLVFVDRLPTTSHQPPTTTFINPFFNFLISPLTMKRVAPVQIAVIHDLIPLKYSNHFPTGIKGNINIYLNKLALKNYDLVVTDSTTSKKDIVQILKVNENRVRVIYPCLPKSLTKYSVSSIQYFKYGIQNTKYCLYVGDATWNKNLVNLAKAIKLANVTCIFVGKAFEKKVDLNNNWLKEYNKFRALINNDKRFILKGFVTDYELVKLYQQSMTNLLLSRDEGFGFSYLEAAYFGCPSVLADILVLKEISGEDGAVFANPNDPEDIAKKIKNLMNDQDLRNVLSLEAQERANIFSSEKFKKDWLKLILA